MADDTPQPYQIPPGFEPDESQIPAWAADDIDRFRVCYAMTMLIAQRFDQVFCKQLYDNPDFITDDIPLADPKREPAHESSG